MEEMIDLEGLTEEEKTLILSVIRRDEELRKEQDTRASQLRSEIHNLRLQSVIRDGDDLNKICARCHKPFGFIFNTGDVCSQCKFRVCGVCRESLLTGKWLCTLCYKQVQLKGLTGEWIQDNVNNEKRRQSQSGIDLVKASLRHSLSNGKVASDYPDPAGDSYHRQKEYGTQLSTGRDYIQTAPDVYTKDLHHHTLTGTVSKTRDGDSGDGVPDTKRGVTRQDSASREDIDRVGYPKNADKKRLSNLFETFKSSKDVPDNDEQDIKHVSCRRHNVSDSDSGSSSDGETPMDVADSKTQSSDQVSSTSAAILAQNLSETESASDLRRDQKESPERKVPNGESQPNSGETVEGAESASTERSRNSVSPEKPKMTPTEAVIFSKRFSGTQDQLMVSQPSSSNSPVSPVCNMSHSPDHKTSIVRRTSSEKSDTSSMSSARTASPATKMRLLDMASKRALERESFDQEESGHDSPRHKPEDTPSNGVNRLRLQPSRTTGGSSSPVRHEFGEGSSMCSAVEWRADAGGGGPQCTADATKEFHKPSHTLPPNTLPITHRFMHESPHHFTDATESREATPALLSSSLSEHNNSLGGINNPSNISNSESNTREITLSQHSMHDDLLSNHTVGPTSDQTSQSNKKLLDADCIDSNVNDSGNNHSRFKGHKSDRSYDEPHDPDNLTTDLYSTGAIAAMSIRQKQNMMDTSDGTVVDQKTREEAMVPAVTGFHPSTVVSQANSDVHVAIAASSPRHAEIMFAVTPHAADPQNHPHHRGPQCQHSEIQEGSDLVEPVSGTSVGSQQYGHSNIPEGSDLIEPVSGTSVEHVDKTDYCSEQCQHSEIQEGSDLVEPVSGTSVGYRSRQYEHSNILEGSDLIEPVSGMSVEHVHKTGSKTETSQPAVQLEVDTRCSFDPLESSEMCPSERTWESFTGSSDSGSPGYDPVIVDIGTSELVLGEPNPRLAVMVCMESMGSDSGPEDEEGEDLRDMDFRLSRLENCQGITVSSQQSDDIFSSQFCSPDIDTTQTDGPLVESAQTDGPLVESAQTDGPLIELAQTDGPLVELAQTNGPLVESAQTDGPLIELAQTDGPLIESAQTDGPLIELAQTDGPLVESAQTDGPVIESAQTDGPLVESAQTDGPVLESAQTDGPLIESAQTDGPLVDCFSDVKDGFDNQLIDFTGTDAGSGHGSHHVVDLSIPVSENQYPIVLSTSDPTPVSSFQCGFVNPSDSRVPESSQLFDTPAEPVSGQRQQDVESPASTTDPVAHQHSMCATRSQDQVVNVPSTTIASSRENSAHIETARYQAAEAQPLTLSSNNPVDNACFDSERNSDLFDRDTFTVVSPTSSQKHLSHTLDNQLDSDVNVSYLTNSYKLSDSSDPSISPLSTVTTSSVLASDAHAQYKCPVSSSDNFTSARNWSPFQTLDSDSDDILAHKNEPLTPECEANVSSEGVGAPAIETYKATQLDSTMNVPRDAASASASSPQSDICSGSDSDVMEVAEFPLYMSPRHSQEAPLSGELSGTEENQLSGEPSSPGAEELNEAENHFGMKETEGSDDKIAHGLKEGTVYEDVMETKSEPSHPCQHFTEGHVPDATSTPNHLEETIDDEHLFQLVSMSRPQVTCPPSQHSPTRRSKDDSELEHVKPSPSAAVTSTAASSAATVINLSTIGLKADNDEGDPFASGRVDISDALQRYLRQEVDELSDCLSVITERTEPEEDELSELSEGLDDTMEDEDLDKEIEKIYQANISIESYCSSDNLSSGSAAAAIRKARREQQKKHIEEVLASPTSFQLQVISEGLTDKPVQSKEEPSEEESDTESVDKVSITSDTISACLSEMSSVDHSNRQTPTSSILVSVDDGAVGNADTNSSETASEEQDSAWFDMSLSVDSVKEVPTAKNSSPQDASMSASTETLCDEDLPQDDVANVDDGRTTPEPHVPETDTNLDSKETLEGNKLVNEKDISDCLKQVSVENDINNANVPQSDSDFPSIPLVPGHDPDATSVPSETLHPISNTSSPPDLHLQDQPVTLTSPTAASPSSPLPECQPDVGVIPPGMSDRTSETESHGGDSGHISGTSAENTPEHKSRHHSHLSIPSLVLTSTSAEEQQDREEEDDIDDLVASHKSIGSLRGSRTNLHSSLTDSRESLYSVYSDAGEINFGKIPATGEILFGLDYNYKTGALEIHIKQCKDIAPVDTKRNRSDPYVKTYLLPDKTRSGKRKTKIKKHTLSPTFDEVLRYVISKSEVENRALWVTVWHNDRFGRNDFLGEVMIPMDCYKFGDASLKWYPLQDRLEAPGAQPVSYKGDLVLSVKFVTAENLDNDGSRKGKSKKGKAPPRGELQVLVKEAKNLTAVRSNGSSDPFCKAYLLPDKNKSNKQKSAVVKRNCNPTWNHVFLFEDVSLEEMKDRSLELTVWDYDKITSNDFLGGVRLNIGTGVASGKTVEWMDARGEEIAIWQSSIDRPNCWNDGTIGLRATMGKSEIRK